MKRPELLAPAGDMDCFMAAVNAGADAIYLGGEEYGARAYASNFSKEELCEAICYAHLFGVKVYLTVNTLVKEREFGRLNDFIRPFYDAGLDGVIVQDLGVLYQLHDDFKGLELHASTQMAIANSYGAGFLKSFDVCRIVALYASVTFLRDVFGVSTVCLYSMKGHWNQSVQNVLSSLCFTTPSPRLDPVNAKYTVKIYADRGSHDE